VNFLTKISLKNSVAVIILCLMVLSGGYVATQQIKLTEFPDVSFPTLLVQARYEGQSALEVEKNVTRPIEDSLLRMQGVDKVMSTSADNGAGIVLAYPMGKNMEDAEQEVKDAIATLRLPEQTAIRVNRTSFDSMPIFRAAILDERAEPLQDMLDKEAIPAIRKIAGVSSANLIGRQTAELRIEVDRKKAMELGITLPAIQSMIASQNYAYPLGSVQGDNEAMAVRLNGSLSSIDAIKRMELSVSGGGKRKVMLLDIATVTQTVKQSEITRYNGQRSLILEVYKTRDANTAEVTSKLVNTLDGYESSGRLQYRVIEDLGRNAEESVNTLLEEGLYGILFTVLIILLFLRNLRATVIAILSLPISIFITVMVLDQVNYTLNMMTLGGLAVSIGRIVDDSIVVIENIFRWRKEKGEEMSRSELVLRATKEVTGAVASSTFATVVVFLPLAFVGGIVGEFFRPFAVTVASSILSSLLVAVIVIPVFGKLFLNKVRQEHKEGQFTQWFEKTMRILLRRKAWVLTASVLLLIGSLMIVPLLGFAFLPSGPATAFNIDITLPVKTGLSETDGLAKKAEDYLHKLPEVESSQVYIGTSTAVESTENGLEKYNEAHFTVQIKKGTDLDVLLERENTDFTSFVTSLNADAKVNLQEGITTVPPQGNNIRIDLYADDLTALGATAKQIENYLRSNDELKNVSNNLKDVKPQWVITMSDAGRTMEVEAGQIARAVGEQLRPVEAGVHKLDGKEWSVTLSYGEAIASKDELQAVRIPTA
jgi:multidrug efflux pump subunit AcrB